MRLNWCRCGHNLSGSIDDLCIVQLPICDDHLLWLMVLCGRGRYLLCLLGLMLIMADVIVQMARRYMRFVFDNLMRLNFHLRNRLFDDDRYAFDVLTQFFVRFFHTRFKCMASAHLMHTLNAYFIGPTVCVVQLIGTKKIIPESEWSAMTAAATGKKTALTCIRATSISISATISPNSGRISFFVVKHTRHTLSNSNVFISLSML